MFKKITDILKEVFWLKPSPKKRAARKSTAKRRTVAKKKTVKVKKFPVVKAVVSKATKIKPPVKEPVIKVKPAVKALKIKEPAIDPNLTLVGEITHYFDRIKVCVVKINAGAVLIGDRLSMIGPKTKFVQKVWSMQIESQDVKVARKGQSIGLKVEKLVAVGDKVYK